MLFAIVGSLNFITADDRRYSQHVEAFLAGRLHLTPRPGHG